MFKNVSILGRLGLGFGVLLGLSIASAAVGVMGLNMMFTTAQHAVANDMQLAQRASSVERLVLNERRFEKDVFINLADTEKLTSYESKWEAGRVSLINEIAAARRLDLTPDDNSTLDGLSKGFDTYGEGFEKIVERIRSGSIKTTQEANGQLGAFKASVHGMEDSSEALNQAASARVDKATRSLAATRNRAAAVQISIALGCLLIGALLCFVTTRSITRPLNHAVQIAHAVATGKLDNQIDTVGRNETAQVLTSLERMQRSLRERIDSEQAAALENGRIRTALDRVSVGAMLADTEGTIIYLNDAMQTLMRHLAGEIRQYTQANPELMLGSSLDRFSQVSVFQRQPLAGLAGAHSTEFKLGEKVLRIVANPVTDRTGRRIGTIVQWYDRTQEAAIEEEVETMVAQAIEGDLTGRILEDGKDGFFKALATSMNRMVGNMADVVRTISAAAAEVGSGADEISRGNADLAQRTEQNAASLEETASSMEEMTSAVKSNADNARLANQLARAALEKADRGGSVVKSAITSMSEINSSSRKITDIISVIDSIAFQTNLLALNAAVEAARAGEQGRGFAVVASEVRNLASRSAAAAKEIKGLIDESVAKVDEGSKLVGASGQVLEDIVAGVKKVADVIGEIASSSQEQASGIEQVNKAVMLMDEGTQQNAALVEQAAAAAESLSEQAAGLTRLIAQYRVRDASAHGHTAIVRGSAAAESPRELSRVA